MACAAKTTCGGGVDKGPLDFDTCTVECEQVTDLFAQATVPLYGRRGNFLSYNHSCVCFQDAECRANQTAHPHMSIYAVSGDCNVLEERQLSMIYQVTGLCKASTMSSVDTTVNISGLFEECVSHYVSNAFWDAQMRFIDTFCFSEYVWHIVVETSILQTFLDLFQLRGHLHREGGDADAAKGLRALQDQGLRRWGSRKTV